MELWLIFALIASLASSVSAFFDNYIVDGLYKGRTPAASKVFYGPVQLILGLIIVSVFLFSDVQIWQAPFSSLVLLFVSGLIAGTASIPYFIALKSENTTSAVIFCQLYPVFFLILSFLFLNETISVVQFIAFALLVAAPFVIVMSKRKNGRKIAVKAALLFVAYVFLSAVDKITFVFAQRDINATTENFPILLGIGILFLGKGFLDITVSLFNKKWRTRSKKVLRDSKGKILIFITVNQLIAFAGGTLLREAMVMGQSALVSATHSTVELLATFVLGLVLTIILPKFGLENLNKRTVLAHFVAMILAAVGIILVENPNIFAGI